MENFSITNMWNELKCSSGRTSISTSSLKSCEPELRELMRQIDAELSRWRQNWQAELSLIRSKLHKRDQECFDLRSRLERRTNELKELKREHDKLKLDDRGKLTGYEGQISTLRNELEKFKRDYDKLQKKYWHEIEKSKEEHSAELHDNLTEIMRLQKLLQSDKRELEDFERQKRSACKQVEAAESQQKIISDKYRKLQDEHSDLLCTLQQKDSQLQAAERKLRENTSDLQRELSSTKQHNTVLTGQLKDLKNNQREASSNFKQLSSDYAKLREQNNRLSREIQNLCDEQETLKEAVSSRDEMLRLSEKERQQMDADLKELHACLKQKESDLRIFENQQKVENEQLIADLERKVKILTRGNEELKHSADQYRDEATELSRKLQTVCKERDDLIDSLKQLRSSKHSDSVRSSELASEVLKLKHQISTIKTSQTGHIEGMRRELEQLARQVKEKQSQLDKAQERISVLEQSHHSSSCSSDKLRSELKVANAQLEALRLENEQLSQTVSRQSRLDQDLKHAEAQVRRLQAAYAEQVESLEDDNKRLQGNITTMQCKLNQVEQQYDVRLKESLSASLQTVKDTEKRHIERLTQDYEQRTVSLNEEINALRAQHQSELSALNNSKQCDMAEMRQRLNDSQSRITQLTAERERLYDELQRKTKAISNLTGVTEAMTGFVGTVQHVVESTPSRRTTSRPSATEHSTATTRTESEHLRTEPGEEDSNRLSIAGEFLQAEKQRNADLEARLQQRIDQILCETLSEQTINSRDTFR